jgi:hypothetical protein
MAYSADTASAATNTRHVAPKKTKSAAKKPRNKPVHPRTSEMVWNAINSLKERGGSSLQAIKKHIAANYKVDSEKLSPFIKKYLKNAVASGELLQTKGKGASGSFKLAAAKTEKTAAPARGRAVSAPKVRKQSAAKVKKAKAPKKAALKSTENKRSALVKAKESPSMAKKVSKVPTKKPKAPRPKTAAKPKAPKKTSPKKK